MQAQPQKNTEISSDDLPRTEPVHQSDLEQSIDSMSESEGRQISDDDSQSADPTQIDMTKRVPWSGKAIARHSFSGSEFIDQTVSHSDISEALIAHTEFMKPILQGELPSELDNISTMDDSNKPQQNREELAARFRDNILASCLSEGQTFAIKTITNCLENYYFGPLHATSHQSPVSEPFFTIVGVSGAGKSWLISNLRKWIELRIPRAQLPYTQSIQVEDQGSSDYQVNLDRHVVDILAAPSHKSYGKSPTLAYSGAAVGVVRGHTIHTALGFARGDLSVAVMIGKEPLRPPSPKNVTHCTNSLERLKF